MNKCICGQPMKANGGCKLTQIEHNGKWINRLPNYDDTCGDCGAGTGKYHHPGCDMEVCPLCGGQFAFCDCYGDGADMRGVL